VNPTDLRRIFACLIADYRHPHPQYHYFPASPSALDSLMADIGSSGRKQ
jgi:hypothetical protein